MGFRYKSEWVCGIPTLRIITRYAKFMCTVRLAFCHPLHYRTARSYTYSVLLVMPAALWRVLQTSEVCIRNRSVHRKPEVRDNPTVYESCRKRRVQVRQSMSIRIMRVGFLSRGNAERADHSKRTTDISVHASRCVSRIENV